MHLKFKRKKDGAIEVVAAVLIGTAIISTLFVYFVSNIPPVNTTYKAEAIARKYMLKMEETGYLNIDNLNQMTHAFKSIGVNNIDTAGTTLNKVQYGDDVYLTIKYKITFKKLTVKSGIIPAFSNKDETVTIKKSSTSKNTVEP
ncbi:MULTISPECIES: hypothetical protein [Clostridium]|uniref:hypothetical protein n=1 Tax=Clostridium TaxID=1485 RepID=UPI0008253899|nr:MULTISPECIES: hypothetical protein [Clostridium]PJI10082.1 hypothetical protein CUB90_20385 [Clostridium sp. CT7]